MGLSCYPKICQKYLWRKSMKPTLPLVLVVVNAYTTFCHILLWQFLIGLWEQQPASKSFLCWRFTLGQWCPGGHPGRPRWRWFCTVPAGHFGFSSKSFTKSAGFIHLLWPILSQTFVWVLRTTTNNCRVIFIDFRIVPLPHPKTEILQDSYCGAMKEPGLPVVPVIVLTSFDAIITSLCPHSKFLR